MRGQEVLFLNPQPERLEVQPDCPSLTFRPAEQEVGLEKPVPALALHLAEQEVELEKPVPALSRHLLEQEIGLERRVSALGLRRLVTMQLPVPQQQGVQLQTEGGILPVLLKQKLRASKMSVCSGQ